MNGIKQGLSFDEYAAAPGANASTLTHMWQTTPLHVRARLLEAPASTVSQERGWLVHIAALEPARYEAEVTVAPKVDRRTKVGKAEWAEHLAAAEGRKVITAEDDYEVRAMASALRRHPTAGAILSGAAAAEVSLFWTHAFEDGRTVPCKARLDLIGQLNNWPVIADVKTTKDASRRSFERSVHAFGYHIQAAHYLAGLEQIAPVPAMPVPCACDVCHHGDPIHAPIPTKVERRFMFLCVETEPPYAVAVYEVDDDALVEGERVRQQMLSRWEECLRTGEWPGYPDGAELVSLPAWAFKTYEVGA